MSEKRLYRVRAVEEYATLAASAKDACRFAREVLADSEPTTSAELMVQPDGTTTYPAGWDGRCLVYGAKPADITLDEAVKAERELLQRAALRDGGPSIPSTQPTAEPEPTLASVLDAVRQFAVSAKAKTHAVVAERMFDAMCCGARGRLAAADADERGVEQRADHDHHFL
jgi:hypothetical protein